MPGGEAADVLVFGGTGFIGRRLVRELLGRGDRVRVYHRRGSDLTGLKGAEPVEGDLFDPAQVKRALKGASLVFDLAAVISLQDRYARQREAVNVGFPRMLGGLLAGKNDVRLIHCGTAGSSGLSTGPESRNEDSPFNAQDIHYFDTKRRGEEAVLRSGAQVVVVRPATVLGKEGLRQTQADSIRAAIQGRMSLVPPGGSSFVDVDDVARGIVLAADRGKAGESYLLSGDPASFMDYFSAIARAGGGRPPSGGLPASLLPGVGWVLERLGSDSTSRDLGRVASRFGFYSSEKACKELGWKYISLLDLSRRLAEAFAAE